MKQGSWEQFTERKSNYMLTVTAAVGLKQGEWGKHLDAHTTVSSVCFCTEANCY